MTNANDEELHVEDQDVTASFENINSPDFQIHSDETGYLKIRSDLPNLDIKENRVHLLGFLKIQDEAGFFNIQNRKNHRFLILNKKSRKKTR